MRTIYSNDLTRSFVELDGFLKMWQACGLDDHDLFDFELSLMPILKSNPVIQGTGGLRKVRENDDHSNKGKSGGYRIIYLDLEEVEKVILLLVYPKNKQDNITPAQKKQLKRLVEELKSHYLSNSDQ